MALVNYRCDYCGEEIDGGPQAGVEAGGILQLRPKSQPWLDRRVLDFHSAERFDGQPSCFEMVLEALDQLTAGSDGESELVWRLVPRARRTEDDGHTPIREEWRERTTRGHALYKLDLTGKADDGLRRANLVTLEEVAARTRAEVEAIDGVGPKSLRKLEAELEKLGMEFAQADEEAAAA